VNKVEITKATASLAEYVQGLTKEPLVVTLAGKPVAALVPVEGMDLETLSVGTNPDFLDLIEQSRRRYREEGGMSSEEIRKHFGMLPHVEIGTKSKRSKKATSRKRNGKKKDGQV
jgi:antitoxin (DNA-binding transcriptional repressor) of toxin-antitoxin stability system